MPVISIPARTRKRRVAVCRTDRSATAPAPERRPSAAAAPLAAPSLLAWPW